MQPGDVVLVVPDGLEGHLRDELGEHDVHPVQLVDRHLVVLEGEGFEPFLEVAHHEAVVQLLLLGEPVGLDGLEAREPHLEVTPLFLGVRKRDVAPAVVVAVVADDRRELGRLTQLVLPLLGNRGLELRAALFETLHAHLRGGPVGHCPFMISPRGLYYVSDNRSPLTGRISVVSIWKPLRGRLAVALAVASVAFALLAASCGQSPSDGGQQGERSEIVVSAASDLAPCSRSLRLSSRRRPASY